MDLTEVAGEGKGFGTSRTGFVTQLHHSLAVRPGFRLLASLSCIFLFHEIRIAAPTMQCYLKNPNLYWFL